MSEGAQDFSPRKEQITESTQVVRFSWKDGVEDEPYYTPEIYGFSLFKDFIKGLQEAYPQKNYPKEKVLDNISPEKMGFMDTTTYLVFDGDTKVVGGIVGKDRQHLFEGVWFTVDPEYQNGETTKKLLEAIQQDYHEVTLLASTFGYDNNLPEERRIRRQQALVEYYKAVGIQRKYSS